MSTAAGDENPLVPSGNNGDGELRGGEGYNPLTQLVSDIDNYLTSTSELSPETTITALPAISEVVEPKSISNETPNTSNTGTSFTTETIERPSKSIAQTTTTPTSKTPVWTHHTSLQMQSTTSDSIFSHLDSTLSSATSSVTPPSVLSASSTEQHSSGLSENQGAIIGIVLGILGLLIITFFGVAICLRRHQGKVRKREEIIQSIPHRPVHHEPPFISPIVISPFSDLHAIPYSSTESISRSFLHGGDSGASLGLRTATLYQHRSNGTSTSTLSAVDTRSSIRDPSPTPIRGVGQFARPFNGASVITVPAPPSYEESQTRDAQTQLRPLNHNITSDAATPISPQQSIHPSIHIQNDIQDVEYEAEAARMAGFVAPTRLRRRQRDEQGRSLGAELPPKRTGSVRRLGSG